MTPEQHYRLNALRQLIATSGESVAIDGKFYDAFVEEITHDEIILAGGIADAGGFRVTVPFPDIPSKPQKGTSIKARGNEIEVMSATERNGVSYEITAGSLIAEEV